MAPSGHISERLIDDVGDGSLVETSSVDRVEVRSGARRLPDRLTELRFLILQHEPFRQEDDRLGTSHPGEPFRQAVDDAERLQRRGPVVHDHALGFFHHERVERHLLARIRIVVTRPLDGRRECIAFLIDDPKRLQLVLEPRPFPQLELTAAQLAGNLDRRRGRSELIAIRGQAVIRHPAVSDDSGNVTVVKPVRNELDDGVARALERSRGEMGRVEDEHPDRRR